MVAAALLLLLLVTEAAAAALVLAGGGRPGARRVAFGEGQAEALAVPRTARKAGPASGPPGRAEKLRFGRHGPCSRRFSSPAGVAGGGGGVAGGGNDFQWCFSQVKGAIDEDVAEGKMRRRE